MSGLLDPSVIVQNSLANPFGTGYANGSQMASDINTNQRNQQRDSDIAALAEKHTPQGILAMSLKYPELSAHIKTAFDQLDASEQKRRVEETIPIYSAALSGRMDVAKKMLEKQALALENSGGNPDEVKKLRDFADQATEDPEGFKNHAAQALAYGMGPENFGKTWVDQANAESTAKLTPAKIFSEVSQGNKDQAEAGLKSAVLPFAADRAQAELINEQNKPGDIAADNANNSAQVAASVEKNRLEQQSLNQTMGTKQQEIEQKRINEAKAYETISTTLAQTKADINELLNHPALKYDPRFRAAQSLLAGTDSYTFNALLDTLKSRNLIDILKVAKANGYTGSMSDKDIQVIMAAASSAKLGMKNPDLIKALNKMLTVIEVSQQRDKKYGEQFQQAGIMAPIEQTQQQPISPNRLGAGLIKMGKDPALVQRYLQMQGQ
jgi:hypothetical protein